MEVVRSFSDHALFINTKKGVIQLLPGKAFALSGEELRSSQVQNLLANGLLKLERTGSKAGTAPAKPAKPAVKSEKKEEEKRAEKKRGDH